MMLCLISDAPVMAHLKSLGPSATDTALRLLAENDGGSDEVMTYFLDMVDTTLSGNTDFELVHSYLALFLKVTLASSWPHRLKAGSLF